ncbi:PIN domain-like protein [Daedalea quercina L-15889]|uniref:PIN domain-like protein n=1 Tax=Daedalea quercina L-15889 TaxID=1314783 RepID=A0A165QNJ0_9APHY|nr:PIN domain-like protein [Daedalea quercina L-15889]
MGIHGLTTYLRESRTALAHTIIFPTQNAKPITIVVDGWSFIFELASWAGLPWIYGGEYEAFSSLLTRVVMAWKDLGLHVCFAFDGAYPALKFPTLVKRATQTTIQVGQLFFRTSGPARSTPRFLRENSLLPPLIYTVCVQTLLDLVSSSAMRDKPPWLEVHFADEEGDPYAVALAARLNAYVVGRDSDYVILNAEGYQGYIPLDEMVWATTSLSATPSDSGSVFSEMDGADDVDGNGFKTVHRSKARRRDTENSFASRGIIPPTFSPEEYVLSLICHVYSPASLADHLQIPVSLLPLLGALVGNDFTSTSEDAVPSASLHHRNLQYMFFERQLTLSQRITRVASTLRSLLGSASMADSAAVQKRRRRQQIDSVMELVDAAVNVLLLRSPDTMTSGELEAIVERIVEATLQYAIPRNDGSPTSPNVCALHGYDPCRLFDLFSHAQGPDVPVDKCSSTDEDQDLPARPMSFDYFHVRTLYVGAYRHGEFPPRALDVLNTGTFWPRLALEDPDKESVSRSVTRPIRQWGYAVLDAGVGLPVPPEEEVEEEDTADSDDELVDVVEEDSDEDPLSPLRDALERLDNPLIGSPEEGSQPATLPPSSSRRPKVVMEYVRRGTRLVPEEVTVPFFSDLLKEFAMTAPESQHEPGTPLPIQLWPEDLRLTFFLRALDSDTPRIRELDGVQLTAVLAVRWVVMRMHARAEQNPSQKEKKAERWTREEVQAFFTAFSWSSSDRAALPEADESTASGGAVPIEERNIQLVTQVSLAIDTVEHFAQLLLLGRLAPNPIVGFSGLRFHTALTARNGDLTSDVEDIMDTCLEGLDSALMTKPSKIKKKRKEGLGSEAMPRLPQQSQRRGRVPAGNMYDVLAAMNA